MALKRLGSEVSESKMANMDNNLDISEVLEKTEKNREWIAKHYDELRKKYKGKVFAVKDERVIEDSDNVEQLLEKVDKKGEDAAYLVIESIPQEGIAYIL